MSCVLDNSVTMRWFFGDGKPHELAYTGKVPGDASGYWPSGFLPDWLIAMSDL